MTRRTAPHRTLAAAGVLLTLLVLTAYFRAAPLSYTEGRVLYGVRDALDLAWDGGARALLDSIEAHFNAVADRAPQSGAPLPYLLALEAWTLFTGDEIVTARWFSVLWTLPGIALIWAGVRRVVRENTLPLFVWVAVPALFVGGMLTATAAGFNLFLVGLAFYLLVRLLSRFRQISPPSRTVTIALVNLALIAAALPLFEATQRPQWYDLRALLDEERSVTEPVIITYADDHPLAAYDHAPGTRFTNGIAIRTGWRDDPTPEGVPSALSDSPVIWLVRPLNVDHYVNAFIPTHQIAFLFQTGDIALMRYERTME